MYFRLTIILAFFLASFHIQAQRADYIEANYTKEEVYIPMRDGVKLYTAIYTPKNQKHDLPILFVKTPYGIKPYGADTYPEAIGPSFFLEKEKYIFVHQDARGMFKSEGQMVQMTPHLTHKPDSTYTDNSSDTYDAVEWLLQNTRNNGRVGLWGISYRGFYAASGIVDAHPAIKCSSPQAPISDWFVGDDMHHHGAFALHPAFSFFEVVGRKREPIFDHWVNYGDYPIRDAYNFYLHLGPLDEVNDRYFKNQVPYWDSLIQHPNYDNYWQDRNIRPHLHSIEPATMVVGGLFDHENLFGSLQTHKAITEHSDNDSRLILGPWIHGGWARTTGEKLGAVSFGSPTSAFYQEFIEMPWFNHYLKQKGSLDELPAVVAFITGKNTWEGFETWPPENLAQKSLFLESEFELGEAKPKKSGFIADEYTSDPQHPVPYTGLFHSPRLSYNKAYICEDQRFASTRPDVLSYQTAVLEDTLTIMGPLKAKLFVSASTSDYDLVVKLIDVYPDTVDIHFQQQTKAMMAGYQQLVRAEIFRVKYRNSYENPSAVIPDKIEEVIIPLNDVCHAFLPGHRVMVQIQSSWFPLFDRNPQFFTNSYTADPKDFKKADISIYRSSDYPSQLQFLSR